MSALSLLADTAATAILVYAALLFVAAGGAKLRDLDASTAAIAAYRLLPAGAVRPVAMLLPGVELATGILLLLPGAPIAVAGAALLLTLFAFAVAINLARGRRDLDCGCGTGARIGWRLVGGNLALAALLLATQAAARPPAMLAAAAVMLALGLWLCVRVQAVLAALPPLRRRVA